MTASLTASLFIGFFSSFFILETSAQDFPLVGQTFVFLNGENEQTHIVHSICDFAPASVIVAHFNQDGTVDMQYANLSGRFIRSTADALDTIKSELEKNSLYGSKLFLATRRALPDTAYSCDAELFRLEKTLRYTHYVLNDADITPSANVPEGHWFGEPPECYAARPATQEDKEDKNLCQGGFCSDPYEDPTTPYHEVCDDAYTECRSIVDAAAMTIRPSTRYYWNLHLFPKMVFHPRHPANGRVMTEISMSEDEAEANRQKALADPGNDSLKIYLNPVFDDSASVYFSGQFIWEEETPATVSSISLEVTPQDEGSTGFSHDPPVAYRIESLDDEEGLQKALLLPFAHDDEEKVFLENLDGNCPGFAFKDEWIGGQAFAVKSGLEVTLPDLLPPQTTDPLWKKVTQEKVQVDGGFEIKTTVVDDKILTDQIALVRNPDFLYGDYFWKGCPDMPYPDFKMTKSELARFLALPVPSCNLASLAEAPEVYRCIGNLFSKPEEADENALAESRAKEAEFLYARVKGKEMPDGVACPDTPLDEVLGKISSP